MLYDPKWGRETMAGFIAWLETKPADEVYIFMDSENCACGQYARAIGVENWMDRDLMRRDLKRLTSFWAIANRLAGAFETQGEWVVKHTFGGLLERCRRHVAETVDAHAA